MTKRSWRAYLSLALGRVLSLASLSGSSVRGKAPSTAPAKPSEQEHPASSASEQSSPVLAEKAWGILRNGLKDGNTDKRAKAVRPLEAFAPRGDPSMVPKIAAALGDSKDDVRFSAAACVAHLSELPEKEKPGGTREAVVLLRLMEAARKFFLDTMACHDIAYHDRGLLGRITIDCYSKQC